MLWKPGPVWPWKTGLAQNWPEWTGDLGQLNATIKMDLSEVTFFLVPLQQADAIIICTPQGGKVPFLFFFLIQEKPHPNLGRRDRKGYWFGRQIGSRCRQLSGARPSSTADTSLSHPGVEGGRQWAGGGYLYSWAGVWGGGNNRTEESSGLGLAQCGRQV